MTVTVASASDTSQDGTTARRATHATGSDAPLTAALWIVRSSVACPKGQRILPERGCRVGSPRVTLSLMGPGGSSGRGGISAAPAALNRPHAHQPSRPRADASGTRTTSPGPHAQLLALQRGAGNKAVAAMLAARGDRPAGPAPAPAPVERAARAGEPAPAPVERTGRPVEPASALVEPASPPQAETKVQLVVQRHLKNEAKWDPVEPVTKQGTRVNAIVGPGHVYGSGPGQSPGFAPFDYMRLFGAATVGKAYCQGHLLNDNLGGPGKKGDPHADENLTAFPQKPTNGDHNKAIEEWVKAAAAKSWFRYEVAIHYGTDSADRLRKRLGTNAAMAAGVGIKTTDKTFTYAAGLVASWEELVDSKAATNAAPVVKVGGISGTLNLSIPSPMTFAKPATRALEFPGGKAKTWAHLPKYKGHQTGNMVGTLPPGGATTLPPFPTRPYVLAERWRGAEEARAGTPASTTGNTVYQAGYQHYGEGVTASRAGPVATTRFGRGYLMGYQDYDNGLEHGRKNPLASPPVGPKAEVDGHNEFWAGVAKGKLQALTAPPTKNRAEIAGHADYWAGVKHARSNPKTTPPVNKAGEKAGHDDYWAGIEHAQKTAKGTPPAGGLAQVEAHKAYWEGAEKALADLAVVAPAEQGGLTGHTEVLEGVAFARANPRTTVHATPTLVRTGTMASYWKGADLARTTLPTVPYAGPDAAIKAAVADYRAGVEGAAKDLGSVTGAAPAGGGTREGFDDFRQGVEAARVGQAADPARVGHVRGWTDCSAGIAEGAAGTAPPSRKDGGFAVGYLYGRGGATARAGADAPTGTGTEDAITGGGHADYLAGLAAAQKDRGAAKPEPKAAAAAFDEFLAGIAKAQAGTRTAPPPAGSKATTAAWTEYWQGVDLGRKAPATTPYAGTSSAESAGHAEYRTGVDLAARDLDALTGTPPAGGGGREGFDDYRQGVDGAKAGQAADASRVGHARGWTDCAAGLAEGDASPKPTRGEGGYASGFLHGRGVATAREGKDAPTGSGVQDVLLGGGHADYGTGLAAARADRTADRPAAMGAGLAFDEYLAGVTKAEAGTRSAPPPKTSDATTAAWTEYWQGVDLGRTDPPTTPYAGTSSAAAAGHAAYRAGVAAARLSLAALTGGGPAGGGSAVGFADYRDGVEERKAGVGVDAGRSGQARGWQDCGDGMAAGSGAADAAPDQAIGGFVSGYLHAQGGAQARAGRPDVVPTTTPEAVRSTGHVAYTAGLAAARRDLGTPPGRVVDRAAFDEYRSSLATVRTAARGVPLPAAGAAAVAAGTDYWRGVDDARTHDHTAVLAPATTAESSGIADYRAGVQHAITHPSGTQPPATTAGAEGAADYWAGEVHAHTSGVAPVGAFAAATTAFQDYWGGAAFARASLAQLQGAAPAGRVAARGFAEYAAGVATSGAGQPIVPARIAFSIGWNDHRAGENDKRGGHVLPQHAQSGYLTGFQNTRAPVVKRGGSDLQSPTKKLHT